MSVISTSEGCSCGKKSGDSKTAESFHSPVLAGQELPAKGIMEGKALDCRGLSSFAKR